MTTYYYKENKKVSLTPDKREAICSDIKSMLKEWYKDLQIIVRNYLDYEKDTMQLFISDWRLVGFGYEESQNKR